MFNHTSQTSRQREHSYFYNMRKYHNHIKRQLYNKYTKSGDSLLELAVGKAGDLNKWVSNNVKDIVGYDIDETSINEGIRRSTIVKSDTNIKLYVKDLSREIITGNNQKDVIVSMFAFHYFFESEQTFNTIMKSITNNIKDDGIFMGTMFDGKLVNNILKNGKFELNDDKITRFKIEQVNKTGTEFGNKMSVFIKDTVLDKPMNEYIVNFDAFVVRMKDYGFDLIESKMFEDLYDENFKLNRIEKGISFLNRTFVFKKRGSPAKLKKSKCNNETGYLMECDWSTDDYKTIILHNYLKAIDKQITKTPGKLQLLLIKEHFTNNKYLLTILDENIKKWYIHIYNMYLNEMKKLQ